MTLISRQKKNRKSGQPALARAIQVSKARAGGVTEKPSRRKKKNLFQKNKPSGTASEAVTEQPQC
jgi:hypothetical protein